MKVRSHFKLTTVGKRAATTAATSSEEDQWEQSLNILVLETSEPEQENEDNPSMQSPHFPKIPSALPDQL